MIPINYLAVLVAAIVNMVVGSLWFGPLFGKPWMKLSGITQEDIKKAKARGMAKAYALAFVGALLMAYVLAHNVELGRTYFHMSSLVTGFNAGFWAWVGFVVPVTMGAVLWEGKSWKLWVLNSFYYLIVLVLNGLLLSYWM